MSDRKMHSYELTPGCFGAVLSRQLAAIVISELDGVEVGEHVKIHETDSKGKSRTGRVVIVEVTYLSHDMTLSDIDEVIASIKPKQSYVEVPRWDSGVAV